MKRRSTVRQRIWNAFNLMLKSRTWDPCNYYSTEAVNIERLQSSYIFLCPVFRVLSYSHDHARTENNSNA